MTFAVHFGYTPTDDAIAHLQHHLDDTISTTFSVEPPASADYQFLISGRPSTDLLDASPHLKTLLIPFAGLPAITRERMADYPHIAIHNLHHNAPPTAEMALALLMASARNLIPSDREFRQHDWTPRYQPYPSVLLKGKTALILGYGAIGEHLGTILKAMGMQVIGTRRRTYDVENGIYPADAYRELLPQADVLIVALPGTDDTENLIDAEALALLPQGAIVINIGRAIVINQQALYDALKSGHLHGAASDVWYQYPPDEAARTNTPPADVPFHELDNMVMSPHRAGGGGNAEIEMLRMRAIADLLKLAAAGRPMPHRVDLGLGY
ncbi:MAG: NAD(P)-dependent oxidoreductase [Phototrophicaceae bacterium]